MEWPIDLQPIGVWWISSAAILGGMARRVGPVSPLQNLKLRLMLES